MHSAPTKPSKLLPANAYTRLAPGEEYQPVVPAADRRAEVTAWSVSLGLVMVVIFSAACIYMALRAGNAIEAAIPIAILAIFFGRLRAGLKSTLLENVIVQSIGQAAGVVAAGAAFVVPAMYINSIDPQTGARLFEVHWWQIFLACLVGGVLGVVLIIPLRSYFVKDLHGELPFPEATAINEILVSGEATSRSAGKVLLASFGVGALYDFLVEGLSLWNPTMTSRALLPWLGEKMQAIRMEFAVSGIAALFGLGYIIGLKYAAIIAAGSVLANLVLVPLVYLIGSQAGDFSYAGASYQIATMSSAQIFAAFVRPIGIGAIAVSGVIGIIRMGKIVAGSVSLGFKGLAGAGAAAGADAPRTRRDMSSRAVLLLQLGTAGLMAALFFVVAVTTADPQTGATYSLGAGALYGLVGAAVGFGLSFLFTPVAAQAIAIVGVNPVSGMTLITVVMTIMALVLVGLKGAAGMVIALIVGTAVCTALSTSGALITDFKIGYWLGATPRSQQVWKFAGIALAALVVAFVIPIMDSGYHFVIQGADGLWTSNTDVLPAPQGNMIAAVSQGLLADPANQPWLLYGLGGVTAIVLYLAGVPMLAFALGMYLPIAINLPILFGAFVAWAVARSGGSEAVRAARGEQGVLIASGMMAGAAIVGIITAILRQVALGAPIQYLSVGKKFAIVPGATGEWLKELPAEAAGTQWFEGSLGQGLSGGMYLLLAAVAFGLAVWGARAAQAEQQAASRQDGGAPAAPGSPRA